MDKICLSLVLNHELKSRKLSLNKLAKDCKIPASVLHGWLNGTLPSAKNLHHIRTLSNYLCIPVDELLFGQSKAKKPQLTLFSSTFMDGKTRYKVTVDKVEE